MIRSIVVWGMVLALAEHAHAKAPTVHHSPPVTAPARTPTSTALAREPFPTLPGIARVRLQVAHDRLIVLEELSLPRGNWTSGDMEIYVAFGAPGSPIAVDAQLLGLPPGTTEPSLDDPGVAVSLEPSTRRPSRVQAVLGKAQMAGVVARLKDTQLRPIYEAGSSAAILRIRSLLVVPVVDATGAQDAVIRLGALSGLPLTLSRIELESAERDGRITRADAHLCGPDADPWPLSVSLLPKPQADSRAAAPSILPTLAVRHASDDLCVRWWMDLSASR